MARLILMFNNQVVKEHPLKKESITIGRNDDNLITIDNLAVSGYHARIDSAGSDYILTDLQSTNGTFVSANGGEEICLMSEEEFPLSGSGVIGLGEMTSSNSDHLIRYSCKTI